MHNFQLTHLSHPLPPPYHLYNNIPNYYYFHYLSHLYLYYFFMFLSFCCCLRFKNPSLSTKTKKKKSILSRQFLMFDLVIFRKLQVMATSGHHARKSHVIRMGAMWVVPQIVQVPNFGAKASNRIPYKIHNTLHRIHHTY